MNCDANGRCSDHSHSNKRHRHRDGDDILLSRDQGCPCKKRGTTRANCGAVWRFLACVQHGETGVPIYSAVVVLPSIPEYAAVVTVTNIRLACAEWGPRVTIGDATIHVNEQLNPRGDIDVLQSNGGLAHRCQRALRKNRSQRDWDWEAMESSVRLDLNSSLGVRLHALEQSRACRR